MRQAGAGQRCRPLTGAPVLGTFRAMAREWFSAGAGMLASVCPWQSPDLSLCGLMRTQGTRSELRRIQDEVCAALHVTTTL